MKLLFVFSHPAPYKVKLFNEISKTNNIDVIFERYNSNRNYAFYNTENKLFNLIKIRGLKIGKENFISFGIKKFLRKNHNQYNHIVMNGYSSIVEIIAINYLIRKKIPYTLMVNGGRIKKNFFIVKKLKTKFISSASKCLCPNEQSKHFLMHYGAREKSIIIYPYSNICNKDIQTKPLEKAEYTLFKNKYNLPQGKLFVTASQFIKRKNIEDLLNIFVQFPYHLIIIGEGPLKSRYIKYIKNNNLQNITILDFKKEHELFEIFKVCDVFVSLSKEDIYGHTIIEALANRLPVVATNNISAANQFIKDGYNGYVVSLDNKEKIIKSLTNSLHLDKNNTIIGLEQYTIEETAKTIIKNL